MRMSKKVALRCCGWRGEQKVLKLGEAGKRWMEREIQRLSDFFASRVTGQPGFALAADGAHPAVGAASILGDDAWKEFQGEFASVRES